MIRGLVSTPFEDPFLESHRLACFEFFFYLLHHELATCSVAPDIEIFFSKLSDQSVHFNSFHRCTSQLFSHVNLNYN